MQHISGGITAPLGFTASGIACGIKKGSRAGKDLALIVSDGSASAAGAFTRNKVKAAPVIVSMEHLESGRARAIVATSGNANACTGQEGLDDARAIAGAVAKALGISQQEVLVASTGVIGVRMPVEKVVGAIPMAVAALSRDGGADASEAILTTDSTVKESAVELETGGSTVRIGGMAKGSGMIHPDLATMLAFITTDISISPQALKRALVLAVEDTFNMITVDGDTSTNDSVIALASGRAENDEICCDGPDFAAFVSGLNQVAADLAKMIVRDGEGATKLIEVKVKGAGSVQDARKIARTIASSNLVKTAVFGNDANWGRILAAAGRAGAELDPDTVDIYLGSVKVAEAGQGVPFPEDEAREQLDRKDVTITVDLHLGDGLASAWTCDLTYDYVKINASYRT